MIMEKLISMVDYVFEQSEIGIEVQGLTEQWQNRANRFNFIVNYANFLKKPLELGMFIHCDLDGNVFEEPECFSGYNINKLSSGKVFADWHNRCKQYQEAKERVLFEGFVKEGCDERFITIWNEKQKLGFSIKDGKISSVAHTTIEDLVGLDLTLTQSAINKLR